MGAQELMQRYTDAWRAGDTAGMQALMHNDVVLHLFGQSPLAGTFVGRDDLGRIVRIIQDLTDRRLIEIHDVLANDDHGVALVRETMERDGTKLELNRVFVYHLRDGKIGEIWVYDDQQAAVDTLWT